MKIKHLYMGLLLSIFLGITSAQAVPLRLDYSITGLDGGRYNYDFRLTLDNNDGSWEAGQGWGNIRFGSGRSGDTTHRLTDFVGDTSTLPAGPFNTFIETGRHFGPALAVTNPPAGSLGVWTPTAVGDSISWSGTSTANLNNVGDMRWGALVTVGTGGNVAGPYIGNLVEGLSPLPMPEPGTMVLAGTGLLFLAARTRQRD